MPKELKPELYELTIKPYLGDEAVYGREKAFTFDGHIKMHFECQNSTKQIVFHSDNSVLKLDASSLRIETDDRSNQLSAASKNIRYDSIREFVTIDMNRECKKGQKFSLELKYTGKIMNVLYGFYKSSYVNKDGKRT